MLWFVRHGETVWNVVNMKKTFLTTMASVMILMCSCGAEGDPEADSDPKSVSYVVDEKEQITEDKTEEESVIISSDESIDIQNKDALDEEPEQTEEKEESMEAPVLLYMGHASLRITVPEENKVIYIDPFCGDGYDKPADLILQTHDHFDHCDMSKIQEKNNDCTVITQKEALSGGEHRDFDLGYVKVEAVEAGFNKNHNVKNCVGYILTFNNEVSLYVSGDTSKTDQMGSLGSRNLDYAFFCCDGVFNMGPEEAADCAKLVGAKVSIPYHSGSASVTVFNEDNAEKFVSDVPGGIILTPGSELTLK